MSDCLFCKFVAGEIPCHVVHEDDEHLAFLTIFPNTEGVTVAIPKKHYTSYVFDVPDDIATKLLLFSKQVAQMIDAAYKDDVGRTGVVMEGFGVNHLHYKLFPMHGTAQAIKEWQAIESKHADERPTKFFEHYEGYLSSHDCAQMDNDRLAKIAERIRSAKDQV